MITLRDLREIDEKERLDDEMAEKGDLARLGEIESYCEAHKIDALLTEDEIAFILPLARSWLECAVATREVEAAEAAYFIPYQGLPEATHAAAAVRKAHEPQISEPPQAELEALDGARLIHAMRAANGQVPIAAIEDILLADDKWRGEHEPKPEAAASQDDNTWQALLDKCREVEAQLLASRRETGDIIALCNKTSAERDQAIAASTRALDEKRDLLMVNEELREKVETMRDALVRATNGLRPFADRVFDDNGDMTVSDTHLCGHDHFCCAKLAHRHACRVLASTDPKELPDVAPEAQATTPTRLAALESENTVLKERRNQLCREMSVASGKLARAEGEIEELRRQLNIATSKIVHTADFHATLRNGIDRLSRDLEDPSDAG